MIVAALSSNPIQFVIQAEILQPSEELRLLSLRWRLVDNQIDELEDYEAKDGLVGHGEGEDQLVKRRLVVLLGLVGRRLCDQVEGVGAL